MFRLAHLSDPHLGPLPPVRLAELASKRLLGYLNWYMHRSRDVMQATGPAAVLDDIRSVAPDHIAVTGDFVNIALPLEIKAASDWLASIGTPQSVSIVPGNHDAYVPGALAAALAAWAPHLTGDGARDGVGALGLPYFRRRGDVAIIGVSSAIATGPFLATGRVGEAQLTRLHGLLTDAQQAGLCRVVLIHHPCIDGLTRWTSRLIDADRFREVIAKTGAELILHGHTHRASTRWLDAAGKRVPVIGVQAASLRPKAGQRGAGWNLFEIEPADGDWRITHVERGTAAGDTRMTELSRQLLTTRVT